MPVCEQKLVHNSGVEVQMWCLLLGGNNESYFFQINSIFFLIFIQSTENLYKLAALYIMFLFLLNLKIYFFKINFTKCYQLNISNTPITPNLWKTTHSDKVYKCINAVLHCIFTVKNKLKVRKTPTIKQDSRNFWKNK